MPRFASFERAIIYDPATEQLAFVTPSRGLWEVHMDGNPCWAGHDPEMATAVAHKAVSGWLSPSVPVRKGGAA
jgi:hypothetical protein